MTTVKIVCGVYAYRDKNQTVLVENGSTVSVSDEEADRLVRMRVAKLVKGREETAKPAEVIDQKEECGDLDSMTFAQLKDYAKSNGITLGRKATTKAAVLKVIKDHEANQEGDTESPDLSMDGTIV